MPATAAAIYARISDDRDLTSLGVTRQVTDCQALADLKGWIVAETYVDNDVSAYSGKVRPEYRRMLDDIKAGRRDALVVYNLDRLHRRPVELEEFFDVMSAAGVKALASCAGDVDLATGEGQFMARIQGAVAAKESADKSRRITRKHQELALAGKSSGGRRGYGYTTDRTALVPDEAAIVKEMARRVLAGDSLRSIASDLTDRNVPTASGKSWSVTTIRQLLIAPSISGRREYHGEIVADAVWPAIITREDSDRLRRMLNDPARRQSRTPRRYPLAGLLYCGVCGEKLISRPREGTRRYICAKGGGRLGCGGVAIKAEDVENFIAEAVLYRLDTPELQRHVRNELLEEAETADLTHSADADQAQLEELATAYADKLLTMPEYLIARKRIEERLTATKRTIGRLSHHSAIDAYVGNSSTLRAQWADLHPSRQRAIIGAVLDRVTVNRTPHRGARFEPERLDPLWRV